MPKLTSEQRKKVYGLLEENEELKELLAPLKEDLHNIDSLEEKVRVTTAKFKNIEDDDISFLSTVKEALKDNNIANVDGLVEAINKGKDIEQIKTDKEKYKSMYSELETSHKGELESFKMDKLRTTATLELIEHCGGNKSVAESIAKLMLMDNQLVYGENDTPLYVNGEEKTSFKDSLKSVVENYSYMIPKDPKGSGIEPKDETNKQNNNSWSSSTASMTV